MMDEIKVTPGKGNLKLNELFKEFGKFIFEYGCTVSPHLLNEYMSYVNEIRSRMKQINGE